MRESPKFYVKKNFGISEDELKTLGVETRKKRVYGWNVDEIVYAVVVTKDKPQRVFIVKDSYVDEPANIYNVKVEEKPVDRLDFWLSFCKK